MAGMSPVNTKGSPSDSETVVSRVEKKHFKNISRNFLSLIFFALAPTLRRIVSHLYLSVIPLLSFTFTEIVL